jgi:nucleotide-binding universal stress UspA family protein
VSNHRKEEKMIKTILVPTDGSEHAKKAVILAAGIAGGVFMVQPKD